jgi:hypothetical protein
MNNEAMSASSTINSSGLQIFLWRWLLALSLVFGTYNAQEESFYHLVQGKIDAHLSVKVLAGLVLAILFTICLRTTIKSMTFAGMIVAAIFVAVVIWVMSDYDLVVIAGNDYVIFFGQIILATVIAIGMSWGQFRRRL